MSDDQGPVQGADNPVQGAENTQQPASAAQQLSQEPQSNAGDPGTPPQPQPQQPQGKHLPEDWIAQSIKDEDTAGWLRAKGFDKSDPEAVAKSYRNLEKLLGADRAGKTVVLPGEDASAEERMEVYNRLGRPDSPDKYQLPLSDDADPEFTKWAQEAFHGAGLTQDQAKAVAEKFTEFAQQQEQSQQAQYTQSVEQEDAALRKEWGQNYDKHISMAQRAARNLVGKDESDRVQKLDSLEKAMGYRGLMEFMSDLGSKLGEDAFVDGGQVQSVHTAKAKIQELEANTQFMDRYTKGEPEAVQTMRRLYQEVANSGR